MLNIRTSLLLAAVSAACAALQVSTASATVTGGSSSSYGESVSLSITPLLGVGGSITSGPTPTASGTAPAPYSDADSLLSATIADLIATGVLNASAQSNVDGSAGSKFAVAGASVDGLAVSILGALGIGATTIASLADVSGDYGALAATGSSTIEGLSLNTIPILNLTTSPDFVLLNALGIKVMLNEQIGSGNSVDSAGMVVNAIHITLDNVPYLWGILPSVLNGDIIISHSEAALTATPNAAGPVPEPATLALLGTGLAGIFGLRRRRAA